MSRILGKGYSFEDVLIVPKYNKVESRRQVDLSTKATRNHVIGNPLISANMDTITEVDMAIVLGKLGGLGVIHRFMTLDRQVKELKQVKLERLVSAVAIGVRDYKERLIRLNEEELDIAVLDIAHGHSKYAGKAIEWIKSNYPRIDVVAGNIATKDAAEYFISKGADALKVGIGPGYVCTTREMTGVGVPQLTAIMDVYEATQGKIPIIADGGIRNSGDIVKAIGAGANSIMSGYLFKGCYEVPDRGKLLYRGSSSKGVKDEIAFIEGREEQTEQRGSVELVVKKTLEGIASGMTYNGKNRLVDFIGKAEFILK